MFLLVIISLEAAERQNHIITERAIHIKKIKACAQTMKYIIFNMLKPKTFVQHPWPRPIAILPVSGFNVDEQIVG